MSAIQSLKKFRFKRELLALLGIAFSFFILMSLFSFHASDVTPWSEIFPSKKLLQKNLGGEWGALSARFLILEFGLAAFLLPVFLLIAVRSLYAQNSAEKSNLHALRIFSLLALSLPYFSGFSAWTFEVVTFENLPFPAGGRLGIDVGEILTVKVGPVGSLIFFCLPLIALVGWALYQHLLLQSLKSAAAWVTQKWQTLRSKKKKKIAQAEPTIALHSDHSHEDIPVLEMKKTERKFAEAKRFFSQDKTYVIPPISEVFHPPEKKDLVRNSKEFEVLAECLEKTLAEFDVAGKIIGYQPGPVVTVYEFQPEAGTKQVKILSLIDDLALALKVDSVLIHPVPGKRALGIQVPNIKRETVYLGEILASEAYQNAQSPLTFAMGKSLSGDPVCSDLTVMPHLLCAGATGSGKSVAINSIIASIIMKSSPQDVRLLLVDPKMLELSVYEGIPHLLMPVITDPTKASSALRWAVQEMEKRYRIMQHLSVRNIAGFNHYWDEASEEKRNELRQLAGEDDLDRLPLVVIVIDELADLMLTAPKDVESSIQRLAQKARASGIHMVLATQRPSVDVITGVIKANLPCRISFQVVSKHDSRTILDQVGSEKLIGKGDMLFQKPGTGRLERLQGAFVSDEEVVRLVDRIKQNGSAQYDQKIMRWIDDEALRLSGNTEFFSEDGDDPKYAEALRIGEQMGAVSASYLQRQLKIGYNRAARMVELMEERGLVGKSDGTSKPRKWLASP